MPPWPPATGSSLPYLLEKATRRLLNFSLLSAFATIVISFSAAVARGSPLGFSGYGVSLGKLGIRDVKEKIGASFGIQSISESMRERWDAKNNSRDYGIARSFGSGLRD